jgi:hypothetical protein
VGGCHRSDIAAVDPYNAPTALSTHHRESVEERGLADTARSVNKDDATLPAAQQPLQERQLGLPLYELLAPTCRQSLRHALHQEKTSTLRKPI